MEGWEAMDRKFQNTYSVDEFSRIMGWTIAYFEEREGMCVALMLSTSDGLIL
jgi:hypothetical protein